mgnify:CR=1 FL=1
MLGEIFYWIFNMSITSAICGIIVIVLRLIKRIPRRVIHILWCIPFIRMCIPFGISGKYGLMTLISRFTTKTVVIYEIWDTPIFTSMNFTMGAENYEKYNIAYEQYMSEVASEDPEDMDEDDSFDMTM